MLPRLTAIRAAAALSVFYYHLHRWGVLSLPLSRIGYTGVAFFFVLSGFVLTWGTSGVIKPLTFYRRRFARVWPSHAVTLLAAATLPVVAVSRGPREAVSNALLVQAWFRPPEVIYGMNGVSWSLSCEVFFYGLFPLTVLVLRRIGPGRRLVLAAMGLTVEGFASVAQPDWAFHLPLLRLPEFGTGVVVALAMKAGWRPRVPTGGAVALLALGCLAARNQPFPVPDVLLAVPFALLIACLAATDLSGRHGLLRHRWLELAGEASFAFYLVHELLIINLRSHLTGTSWIAALLMLAASAALALLLYVVIERPLNQVLRNAGSPATSTRPGARRRRSPPPP